MFIAKTNQGDITESKETTWMNLPDDIEGVYLVHPLLNLSIGLHQYDRYAFVCEGAVVLQSNVNMHRIAEHLYATKDDRIVHICIKQNGSVISELLDSPPDIADNIWRKRG